MPGAMPGAVRFKITRAIAPGICSACSAANPVRPFTASPAARAICGGRRGTRRAAGFHVPFIARPCPSRVTPGASAAPAAARPAPTPRARSARAGSASVRAAGFALRPSPRGRPAARGYGLAGRCSPLAASNCSSGGNTPAAGVLAPASLSGGGLRRFASSSSARFGAAALPRPSRRAVRAPRLPPASWLRRARLRLFAGGESCSNEEPTLRASCTPIDPSRASTLRPIEFSSAPPTPLSANSAPSPPTRSLFKPPWHTPPPGVTTT